MLGRLSGLKLIIIIIMILQMFLRARRLPNIARPLGEPAKAFHKSFKKGDGQQPPAGANNLEGHGRLWSTAPLVAQNEGDSPQRNASQIDEPTIGAARQVTLRDPRMPVWLDA